MGWDVGRSMGRPMMAVVQSEGACLLEGEAHDAHEEADAVVFVVIERAARRVGVALGGGGGRGVELLGAFVTRGLHEW